MSSKWENWPVWDSKATFHTENFRFTGSVSDYTGKTDKGEVVILKDHQFIDIYRDLLKDFDPRTILEIGFFQGGMLLFLADMIRPSKIVGIDCIAATPALLDVVANSGLGDLMEFVTISDQSAAEEIKGVISNRFGDVPLDMIIDDCSHMHDNTKICFENTFGYLRPGGKYIIEDWGWTHWVGAPWQDKESFFHNTPSMTNLIFELVMVLGSDPGLISNIEIASAACVIVTRGPGLPFKSKIVLKDSYRLAGRDMGMISDWVAAPQHVVGNAPQFADAVLPGHVDAAVRAHVDAAVRAHVDTAVRAHVDAARREDLALAAARKAARKRRRPSQRIARFFRKLGGGES